MALVLGVSHLPDGGVGLAAVGRAVSCAAAGRRAARGVPRHGALVPDGGGGNGGRRVAGGIGNGADACRIASAGFTPPGRSRVTYRAAAGGGFVRAMHFSSVAIGVGNAVMPSVVRQGAAAGSGKYSAQTAL